MKTIRLKLVIFAALLAVSLPATAQNNANKRGGKPSGKSAQAGIYDASVPKPDFSGVRYGKHERNVLDLWMAKSEGPAPLVFFIHGGGWVAGSKEKINVVVDVPALLKAGISVAGINYRYTSQAAADGVTPPVKAPLSDAARALQFVRSKSAEWNLDKTRIGLCGSSAGACTSLWLAFHADFADPSSSDPIARESTKPLCAAVKVAQTSLDPQQMKEWTPNSKYGGHAFGLQTFQDFLDSRNKIAPLIAEYSPIALLSKESPPVYLIYPTAPNMGNEEKDPTHSANFGVKLKEKCDAIQVPCELVYPSAPGVKHATITDYLIDKLKTKR